MKTLGILTSHHITSVASIASIISAIETLNEKVQVKKIDADTLINTSLDELDLLVNPLGACYNEEGWQYLLGYYQNGGTILNIGLKPFTIPYLVRNDKVEYLPETAEAIHSTYVLDEYQTTGAVGPDTHTIKVQHPRYLFLNEFIARKALPAMDETCSIFYHLAEKSIRDDSMPMAFVFEVNLPDSQVEVALGYYDADGRLMAAPITRMDHHTKGSFVFLNFTPKEKDFFNSTNGIELLNGIIASALQPAASITIYPDYPKYNEKENVNLLLGFEMLRYKGNGISKDYEFTVRIERIDNDLSEVVDSLTVNPVDFTKGSFETQKLYKGLKDGDYQIIATLNYKGITIAGYNHGFLRYSASSIANQLKSFRPITIDASVAPDYCVRDGKPFAMHGTTYFVTDKFRNYLFDFNPTRCDLDLKQLSNFGFNIIRTGNWHNVLRMYDDEGNIQEYSLRALEALFLIAARHDLPVQFVFAAYIFNPWDRGGCPVHNPVLREKTIRAASCFAQRFKGWPNVMVDAINEPSYSIFGLWQPVRPSGDKKEEKNFRKWLGAKYDGDISLLRKNWGVGSNTIKSFDDVKVPAPQHYDRGYDIKPSVYHSYASLTDFYEFARDSYSNWVSELLAAIRSEDPSMMFMMGRDEPLRVPAQQYEAYKKNYDLINWHQWHTDSLVFMEYALNRVRNLPCCGQELGVYYYSDQRNKLRFNENEYAYLLERKLCYSFGNWVQWQSVCDPFMVCNVEIFLGLIRYDGTETRHMSVTRMLAWIEERTAHLMTGRNEDANQILTVHPTYLLFSGDAQQAKRAINRSITAMHYHANMQSDYVLEDLLREDNSSQTGSPKLIVMPGFLMLSDAAWEYIVNYMNNGGVVLFSGDINIDEFWISKNRIAQLGVETNSVNANTVERIAIGDETFCVSFRECVGLMWPGTVVQKTVFPNNSNNAPVTIPVGKGKLIYSPLPLELGDAIEPVESLYNYALKEAGLENQLCKVKEALPQSNLMIYPIEYDNHVVYTIVNEGDDDKASFVDLKSGSEVELEIPSQRAAKLWIRKDGQLTAAYINGNLRIGNTSVKPDGDLAICYNGKDYDVLKFSSSSDPTIKN